MSGFPETDIHNKVLNLGLPPEEITVVGSAAIEMLVGPDVRRAQDIDVAVTDDLFAHLRSQPDMEYQVLADGHRRVVGGGFDFSVGWDGKSVQKLQQGGYVTDQGLHVVGLPDLYARKQNRLLPKDPADLEIIRQRLHSGGPLPRELLAGELDFVLGCMPEHLRDPDRPELVVAANGLYLVRTLFGEEGGEVRTYSGSVERHQVPAAYHAWEHSAYGARDGQRNMDAIDAGRQRRGLPPMFSDRNRLTAMAGYSNHDAILGHGRQALNPTAHDEKQSAELVVRHLEAAGVSDPQTLEEAYAGVIATTFSEAKKAQDVDPARGYVEVQQINAGSDLSGFRRTDAVPRAMGLAIEDFFRDGAGYDHPLARLVDELNSNRPAGTPPIRVTTAREGLSLIDAHPDFMVTKAGDPPQTMTLAQAFAAHIMGSSRFIGGYKYPVDWVIGDPAIQARNSTLLGELSEAVAAGRATTTEAYNQAEAYDIQGRGITTAASAEAGTSRPAGDSIGEVAEVIAAVIESLPAQGTQELSQQLQTLLERLESATQGSANPDIARVGQLLSNARQLLDRVQDDLLSARNSLKDYNDRI